MKIPVNLSDWKGTLTKWTLLNYVEGGLEDYGYYINDSVKNYIDYENKKYIQKVGRINLDSLNYIRRSDLANVNCFSSNELTDYLHSNAVNALCSKYTFVGTVTSYANMDDKGDKCFALYYSPYQPTTSDIYINDSDMKLPKTLKMLCVEYIYTTN